MACMFSLRYQQLMPVAHQQGATKDEAAPTLLAIDVDGSSGGVLTGFEALVRRTLRRQRARSVKTGLEQGEVHSLQSTRTPSSDAVP